MMENAPSTPSPPTSPRTDWLIECQVALTEAEVERLAALVTKRFASSRERAQSWRLFWWQIGLGSLVALAGVLLHAVRAEKAGIVAVAGWLACWAAMAIYARAVEQGRRHRLKVWRSTGYAYQVAVQPSGVRLAWRDDVTEMSWLGFSQAELCGMFVMLWRGQDSPVTIPARALPPDWQATDLVARCTACITGARPAPKE